MKMFSLIISIIIQPIVLYSQSSPSNDDILNYFQEIKENIAQHSELWDIDLYGPILLVDRNTRFVFANYADDEGVLKEEGSIFTGYLPERVNIANTAVDWNGKRWAMIVLPLHENKQERLDWISHELFHRSQPELGFELSNPDNDHLDEKDGRVYMRLEIETHFIQFIESFHQFPTFVRSFAYLTTPIYGYLLQQTEKFWNKEIHNNTNLTNYLISSLNISMPDDPAESIQEIFNNFGGKRIEKEENKREEDIKLKTADYKSRFIENPHLEITLENMSISFDALNIFPLDGFGSVYPTLRLTDNWGVLTVNDGALLGPNWKKVTLSKPLEIGMEKVIGNGWVIDIESGYEVVKNKDNDNYTLRKKQE